MARSRPYQPLLLRILHNLNALLILGALITGYWVYNTYDGRFGKLPLPQVAEIIDIHGTIAVFFFFVIPVFALYSFHAGQQRLVQPDSLQQLAQLDRPIGWISLHRLANTVMLLAATLSAVSGRMMKEEWLPAGELNHAWYFTHLIAWLILLLCLLWHLLMVAKVGGSSLFAAMLSFRFRSEDSPTLWASRFRNWLRQLRAKSSSDGDS